VNIVRTSEGMLKAVRAYFDPAAIEQIDQSG
jgi:hypothetical protein